MTLDTFDLEKEKGCDSEDACRCVNELLHKLTEDNQRPGAAANRTLSCDKKNFISSHEVTQASLSVRYLEDERTEKR